MTYTMEEVIQLRNCGKQMEAWIRENIMPYISESITVEFGDMTTRRGAYGMPVREKKYELYVRPDDISGGSGGLRYFFMDKAENTEKWRDCDGTIWMYSNMAWAPDYLAAMMQEWLTIKAILWNKRNAEQSKREAIRNFCV